MLAGCNSVAPETSINIQTDRTAYELDDRPGIYSVELEVSVTNPLDQTVYLHRECGSGDEPSRYPVRMGDDTETRLGGVVCITQPTREPIPLGAGDTFHDHVRLTSTESPGTNPPITMAMRTGTFRLVYDIQPTDSVEGRRPVDPFSRHRTSSNRFTVDPPAGG